LDEVDDFITNAAFTETNILELVYDEPSVSISIDAPEVRNTCYNTDVELEVVNSGGSACAEYELFVNHELKKQGGDTIKCDLSYGDWVKVRVLGGATFSDSILIDTSYFRPLKLESTSHINFDTLCPGEEVDFQIALGSCGPSRVDLYKVNESEPIAEDVSTDFTYRFKEADEIYAVLEYYINDEYVYIQTNTFSIGEILSVGDRYKFLNSYVFSSTQKSIDLMELNYDTLYSTPFNHRVIHELPISLGDTLDTTKVYKYSSSQADYLFYRFDVPYTNFSGDDIIDTMAFKTELGIRQGEGVPNFLKLYFGQYHSTYDKYCYDSTQTAVYVLRDDVFIPKSAFCSNDDEEYTIEINTDLTDYANTSEILTENVYSTATYAGYKILVTPPYNGDDFITDSSGHIIHFKPSEWDTIGYDFTIHALAKITTITVTSSNCPAQWYKYGNYNTGDSVYHNGRVYVALKPIRGTGIIFDPNLPGFELQSNKNGEKGDVLPGDPNDPGGPGGPDPNPDPGVIYITPGIHTAYWDDVGTCSFGSSSSTESIRPYANNKFDIIDPATNGRLLNFPTTYCFSNENITLESNYTITSITGGNGAINKDDEGTWHFIPENMVPDGQDSIKGDITLYYKDYYGCAAEKTYSIEVNQTFTSEQELDLSLEDRYCKTNKKIPITSNFELLEIIAPGVNDTVNPKTFTPEEALGEKDSARVRFDVEYRDDKHCWDHKTFNIIVNKNYDVDSGINLSLDDVYCLTNNQIHVTSNFEFDTIIGPGIWWRNDSTFFEAEQAAGGLTYLDTSLYVEFRDDNDCWYNKSLSLTIDKTHNVDSSINLSIDDYYCLTNDTIHVTSNLALDTIIGPGIWWNNDSIFFEAEMAAAGLEYLDTSLYVEFRDDNNCWYNKSLSLTINKTHNVDSSINLSIDDYYCLTNDTIHVTSNLALDTIIGPGIWWNNDSIFFEAEMAAAGLEYLDTSLYVEFRDANNCWYNKSLRLTIDKNYRVDSSISLSLNDNYCLTNNQIHITSNLTLDTIIGPGILWMSDSIFFEPELAAGGLNYLDTSLYVAFRDNNKCWYDKNIAITIDKEYSVQRNVELNLDSVYCPVNDSIELVSNYSIISLIGNGISFEDNTYTFNPFIALNTQDEMHLEIPLVYRDYNNCLYDKLYNVEINRFKLVDSSGYVANLENNYCLADVDYPIQISNQYFSIDELTGYGVYKDEETNQYFYNAFNAIESTPYPTLKDTVVLKYFDDNGCPFTHIEVVDVDSANVNAAANLLFEDQYCAANKPITIAQTELLHKLYNVEGYGATFDEVDSVSRYNAFTVYENSGLDTMNIYTNLVVNDIVSAYFMDRKNCTYKKDYEVQVSGSFANNLNGYLVDFRDEYCQFEDQVTLVGDPGIDTLIGPGLRYDEYNNRWALDPSHEVFVSVEDDVFDSILYYYRDNLGCPWFNTHTFNVYARPEPDFTFENLCEGDFTKISDETHLNGEGIIDSWDWTFGDIDEAYFHGSPDASIPDNTNDGNTIGEYATPKHHYPGPGEYNLSLRVISNKGCENDTTKNVIIGGYPEVDFEFDSLLQHIGTWFTNKTEAEPFDQVVRSTWDWDDNGSIETFPGSTDVIHQFNTLGVHNVKLTSITGNGCEDSLIKKVPIFEYITVTTENTYKERFNDQNHGWLAANEWNTNLTSGWKQEEVSGNLDKFPITEGSIWRTGDPLDSVFGEDAWIESPGFDISQLDFPVLSLDIYQSVETGRDGAVVQYTLNDGDSWNLLGDTIDYIEEGVNWYNQTGIISNPGNQTETEKEGWTGYFNSWQTARFPLDKVRSDARKISSRAVRFRIAYASDEGNMQGIDYDGFAFDNFNLTSRSRVVLLEQFVNTEANYSLARNEERWLNDFLTENPDEVVGINYHNYIANNYDTLYYLNTPDISARSTEYGAYLEQLTMVDGLHRCVSPSESEAKAYYRMRSLKDKTFDINVETGFYNNSLHIQATVTKLVDTLNYIAGTEKCVVRMALIQKEMVVNDTIYKNVLVELLPTGIGNVVGTIPAHAEKGYTDTFEQSWYPNNITTDGQQYRLVVYVQGIWGVDEVHQVWFKDLDNNQIPLVTLADNDNADEGDDMESFNDDSESTSINLDYLKIYPLPAENELYLDWKQELEYDVNWKLVSMSGQEISFGRLEKSNRKHLIETDQIPAGVYLLMLHDDDLNYIEKRMIIVK
jgi:hypothetical protein